MGRPRKYNPKKMLPIIEKCAGRGYTDEEIARKLGISVATFYNWQKEFLEFLEAVKRGKKVADNKVEQKLYKRAIGYKIKETTREPVRVFDEDGNEIGRGNKLNVTKTVTKNLIPDVGAIKMWLINRKPEEWRDKQDVDVGGTVTILQPETINKPDDTGMSE